MTVKNRLKKPVLFSLGILAAYHIGSADAYNTHAPNDMKPSIEINMDVLDKLAPPTETAPTAKGAAPSSKEEASPFGPPSKPLGKKETKKKKAKHKKKVVKKPRQVNTAPEIKVTPEKPQTEDNNVPVIVPIPGKTEQSPAPAPLPKMDKLPEVPALPPANNNAPTTKLEPLQPIQPVQPLPPSGNNKPQELPPVPPAPVVPPTPAAPVTPSLPDNAIKELQPLPQAPSAPPAPPSPALPPALPPASDNSSDLIAKMPPMPGTETAEKTPAKGASKKAPADTSGDPDLRIVFSSNETDVPLNTTGKLDGIAMQLIKNPDLRASIIAYASGSDAISIYPKRVSLARGIAVRDYLTTARNIDVERVTVKALGNKSEAGPADRVDLYLIK